MNHQHCVPEFDMDEFYSAPSSSGQSRKTNMQEDDDIMELVWHDGQIGALDQNRRLFPKLSPPLKPHQNHQEELHYHHPPSHSTVQLPPMPESASTTHLFMQEDEMTSWLHYPLDDVSSFDPHLTDLLSQPPGPSIPLPPLPANSQSRPPPASPSASGVNFPHFARLKGSVPESGHPARSKNNDLRALTVGDSSGTPAIRPNSLLYPESISAGGAARTSMAGGSVSGAMATADLMTQPPVDDRKRKGKVSTSAATTEIYSEDLEIESFETKKQYRGTAVSGKRSRGSEVHNLSERRRRDRINEKMKALQELIPSCSKTDKASMLEEAIDYLKSLQMQVQMMSMGYHGMVPMLFPGTQQYIPMTPMRLGMGMETAMPFPAVLTGSPMATPGAQSLMGPRFPFPMLPTVESFDPPRVQTNQMVSVPHENVPGAAIVVKMPADSYQQSLGARQMHAQQIPQNPQSSTPTTSKTITVTKAEENQNHPNGTG